MAFSLSSITKGKSIKAPRLLLYGTHGIGKSTFGASSPHPIFIQTEDGLGSIDTSSFPLAKTSIEVYSALTVLAENDHDYQTLVIDSADWLEDIFITEINAEYDDKQLAYGKGSILLTDRWAKFLEVLTMLRDEKNMTVILIAHQEQKRVDSPENEPFDRYQPKLSKGGGALVQEWTDAVLFASSKILIKKDALGFDKSHARGIATGKRVMHTQETPAFLAKNRYALPPELPFTWQAFQDAVATSAAT